jgi:hypothetical protein
MNAAENQEWIPVTTRRRTTKKGSYSPSFEPSSKKDMPSDIEEIPAIKKRIESESLQQLIRKRIQMKVNQEKADTLCAFPRNTFKNIESNRLLPIESQLQRIERVFDIILKINIVS